jgi:hypothetical protein
VILPRIVNLVSTIALLVATAMPGFAVENLQLDRTTGSAPLTVKVIQPSVLVERLEDWKKAKSRAGPGGYVNWGDAPQGNDTTHVFTKPGTYTVKAGLYRIAPSDAHVYYWHGQAKVTVTVP